MELLRGIAAIALGFTLEALGIWIATKIVIGELKKEFFTYREETAKWTEKERHRAEWEQWKQEREYEEFEQWRREKSGQQ